MNDLFYLSRDQLERIAPYFPKPHGVPRVDDLKVISGIIHVLKRGLQWRDAPKDYGPYKTLYNRFIRWSQMGVFDRIFTSRSETRATRSHGSKLGCDATLSSPRIPYNKNRLQSS